MRGRVLIVICAVIAFAPPAARGASAQQAADELNAQRSANGIPAGITVNSTWSNDCALHDHYMATNHVLTHQEDPSLPAYTTGGAYAGGHAVLDQVGWDTGDPYETAPLHLDQLLAPRLASIGSADAEGYSCTTTFPGWTRPDPLSPTVYTYPGNGAQIYPSETAREGPWTPGDLVGIPQPTTTGPYIVVLVDAPGQNPAANPATLTGATLTGSSGPVPVKTADGNTPTPGGGTLAGYLSPGGFIIPVAPLAGGATYSAHVDVTFAGVTTPHDWSFTTTAVPLTDPHSRLSGRGATLAFGSLSPAPIVVGFTRANGAHAASITITPGASATGSLPPGRWQACGHQPATAGFSGYDACLPLTITGVPRLHFGRLSVKGRLHLALSFSSVLRGRRATLRTTTLTVRCTGHRCTTISGPSSKRTIVLGPATLSFARLARHHGLRVKLSTSAFRLGDAPWDAAYISVTVTRR